MWHHPSAVIQKSKFWPLLSKSPAPTQVIMPRFWEILHGFWPLPLNITRSPLIWPTTSSRSPSLSTSASKRDSLNKLSEISSCKFSTNETERAFEFMVHAFITPPIFRRKNYPPLLLWLGLCSFLLCWGGLIIKLFIMDFFRKSPCLW